MKIHISYQACLRHNRTHQVFNLWRKTTSAETSTIYLNRSMNTIWHQWAKGNIDLLIEQKDFFKLTKEIEKSQEDP